MRKKRVKLAKNFYYSSSGSIQFRKMVRGKLITGRTGITDPYEVNKLATDIANKFINEHYQLKKPEKKQGQPRVLLKKFLKYKEDQGKSIATIKTYKSNINSYLDNGIPVLKSKSFQNSVRRDYNIFARWCLSEGYSMVLIKGDTNSEARSRILTNDEFQSILSTIPLGDFRDCIEFIYFTGCRRKEANRPKIEWLRKTEKGDYYIEVIRKGGYKRIVRVFSQALEILEKRNYVFWDFDKQWLTRGFKIYSRRAGIEDVQLHDLRRTYGYNLLKGGQDIAIVAKLMGISVKVAEKHYTPLHPIDIADIIFNN